MGQLQALSQIGLAVVVKVPGDAAIEGDASPEGIDQRGPYHGLTKRQQRPGIGRLSFAPAANRLDFVYG